MLESEARLAASALGLDPGLGVLHVDAQARDSLACDLMESARPQVDAYLVDWFTRQPLKREWFFEERNGNCRLMGPFATRLSETAPTWGRAVAPVAEWVAQAFWSPPKIRRTRRKAFPRGLRNAAEAKAGVTISRCSPVPYLVGRKSAWFVVRRACKKAIAELVRSKSPETT
jgi:hypothetical protein